MYIINLYFSGWCPLWLAASVLPLPPADFRDSRPVREHKYKTELFFFAGMNNWTSSLQDYFHQTRTFAFECLVKSISFSLEQHYWRNWWDNYLGVPSKASGGGSVIPRDSKPWVFQVFQWVPVCESLHFWILESVKCRRGYFLEIMNPLVLLPSPPQLNQTTVLALTSLFSTQIALFRLERQDKKCWTTTSTIIVEKEKGRFFCKSLQRPLNQRYQKLQSDFSK